MTNPLGTVSTQAAVAGPRSATLRRETRERVRQVTGTGRPHRAAR